jgi:serine/threonine-protein kinase
MAPHSTPSFAATIAPMNRVTTKDARVELGPYLFRDVLGDGATGIVYLVSDPDGRQLALKVLRQELALSERERSRFLEEAERLRRVRHPALVEVVDAGVLPNYLPYIAMPFLSGCSLATRLTRGPMPFDVALHLFQQLADALHTLHGAGLVHRDIKPENIFVVEGDRQAILLDLGIARDVNASPSTTTHAGLIRGTPAYMAPERFFGAPATPATDIYELGVVLYVTLVGMLPWMRFDDPTERMRPASPASRGVVLPQRLSSTLMRALAVSPGERPQSAQEFATSVIDALSPESAAQIANQATSAINRLPPAQSAMFGPTTMASRQPSSSTVPSAGPHAHTPAAYAPTVMHASAPPATMPSYATGPAIPAYTAPPATLASGQGAPPIASYGSPPSSPAAGNAKRRSPAVLVAALTGATLLATGGLAIALFVGSPKAFDTASQGAAPVGKPAENPSPALVSSTGATPPPAAQPQQQELVVAAAAKRKGGPAASGPAPTPTAIATATATSTSTATGGAPGGGLVPKEKSVLPTPPQPNPFPTESLENCRTLAAYQCLPDVDKVKHGCFNAKFQLDNNLKEKDPNVLKGRDMLCASQLRSLASQR